ncbi:MAG: TIGR03905 family TSCPD domain-containing protein [Coriobacteriaceae bacterium]|jgi:uncharacterized protein (TIGR03905 family)|nr:TIGR03905 family TSCPD domain-containing protein [Coriobacteriaceae bacterium]
MSHHSYRTRGTCARSIDFDIEDGKLRNVSFAGGCNGNLKAIGKLVEGADAESTARLLEGNTCGPRPTSCADQLSRAIDQALQA